MLEFIILPPIRIFKALCIHFLCQIFTDGVQSAALSIVQEEGFDILFSGLGPTVIGYGIEGALKFGTYETLKPVFVSLFMTDDRAIPFLAASVVAGAIASLLLCPVRF